MEVIEIFFLKAKICNEKKTKLKKKTRASFLPPNPKVNGAFTSPIMA